VKPIDGIIAFVCFSYIFVFCDRWHCCTCIYSFFVELVLSICVVLVLDECIRLCICVLI